MFAHREGAVSFDDAGDTADVIRVSVGEHDLLDALAAGPFQSSVEHR